MNPDTTHMNAIDALQTSYVMALDAGDMTAWAATFSTAPETSYFCIAAENDRRGLPIALMYDDCRARIDDRITFVDQVWVGTYQPYRTRHLVQRLTCEPVGQNVYSVMSSFLIMMTAEGGATIVMTSGVYRDVIEVQGNHAVFRGKRAVYDADVLPRYLVFPF